MKGLFCAIEGTDGCGKRTQTELLVARLLESGYQTQTASFPQYGKKSAGPVEELLNGRYGPPDAVDPKIASLLYAIDRFDKSSELKSILGAGKVLILDRYVDSNAAHQGGKITDTAARERFIEWLYDLEYGIIGCPQPDLSIILHMPAEVSFELIAKKQSRAYIDGGGKRDAIEENIAHLKRSEECYLWLAQHYGETHTVIECIEQGTLLSPDAIHERIWEVVHARLVTALKPTS